MVNKTENDSRSLLECLSYLTGFYGHSKSTASLAARLRLDPRGVTPALFITAADRIGLNARFQKISRIKEVDSGGAPFVLVLKNNRNLVVLSMSDRRACIWDPAKKEREEIALDHLKKMECAGVLLVRPRPEFIDSSLAEETPQAASGWVRRLFWSNAGLYTQVLVASVLINLFALASPIYVMNVYDRVIPNNAIETGWALSIGVLIVFTFDLIIRMLRSYFIDFASKNIDVQATQDLYDHVLDMKLAHRPASSGAFANMLREFDSVREFLTSATLVGVVDLPFSILFVAMIFVLGGSMGGVILLLMALSLALSILIQIPLARHVRQSIQSSETKHGLLVETIHHLENIKMMGADARLRTRYAAHISDNADHSMKSRYYSALGVNISTYIQQVATVIIILWGMYLVQDLSLQTGGVIACVMLSGRALSPIIQMANLTSRYHHARAGIKTLNKIMATPTEHPPGRNFLYRPTLKGAVQFDRVSFAYPGSNMTSLHELSFTIQPGEKVGIVGRIGSGKSTLARLLMGLYEPSAGNILIDGSDMRQIAPVDLRRNVTCLSQDVTLLRGTVRENITASAPHASEEDVLAAAQKAGAHAFISVHPHGYDAQVGEDGAGFSGGQKQCIALARALLALPSLLVCDEPTNAMDMQTEDHFSRMAKTEFASKTLILITHRTSLLQLVDRLILMDRGRILMDGPRDDVLAALAGGGLKAKP